MCSSDLEPIPEEIRNEKTLLMYMPWSSNLTSYFYQNIKDMESCIEELGGLSDERVLVFISTSPTEPIFLKSNMKKALAKEWI